MGFPNDSFKSIVHLAVFAAVLSLTGGILPSRCSAYSPEHPVVQQMVASGIKYLEGKSGAVKDRGEVAVMAYAHYKAQHDENNALVKRGIQESIGIIQAAAEGDHSHKINYEVSVATLLLATVSPERYRTQLSTAQRFFNEIQLPNGPFTYHNEKLGDVSQTQYVLLAIWTLDRAGFPLDYKRVQNAAEWLVRVQDADGPWPYHGEDPGPGSPLQQQKKASLSMALAGGSSLLIAGDALRVWGDTIDDADPGIVGLPEAVKLYKEDKNVDRRKRASLSRDLVMRSINFMNKWRQAYQYKRTNLDWYYYQMYTLERFESFYEIATGAKKDDSPAWYNQGVEELKKYQTPNSGWEDPSRTQGHISTTFAILFLIRSTQKTVFESLSQGTVGGQGFKKNIANAKLVNGQAVVKEPAKQVGDLLDMLDGEMSDEFDEKAMSESAKLAEEPTARAAQLDRLERMVRGSNKWQARRVAAKLLATSDELRVVPALIFALSDPDLYVRRYARDGLRFISRKFEGFGMPDKPTNPQLRAAQKKWRDWYRTMNPGFVFIDEDL